MNQTKIPWCDYTINPVKGLCPVDCKHERGKSYCYARRMYKRFKWNPEIRFEPEQAAIKLIYTKPGNKIFWGSTIELFGDWVEHEWLEWCLDCARIFDDRIHIFLTKLPQNLPQWSPFPSKSCWVGVSITSNGDMTKAYYGLSHIEAPVRFASFEPLLGSVGFTDHVPIKQWLDWLIIGSQTQPVRHPEKSWVEEILQAADKAHIPVFVKEPLASYMGIKREQLPGEQGRQRWER